MQGLSAESTCRILAAALVAAAASHAALANSIVKPPDGAWIPGGEVEVIAMAAGGRLFVDGEPVRAREPFPGVLHFLVNVGDGRHTVRLESADGSITNVFHVGADPGIELARPYTDHPPVQTACTHCHSVSRRGRFRFSGGCDSCHGKDTFIQTHSHEQHELASCGMCHDAHGSSTARLLVVPQEQACKQCHN